jgi:hypothetical protein
VKFQSTEYKETKNNKRTGMNTNKDTKIIGRNITKLQTENEKLTFNKEHTINSCSNKASKKSIRNENRMTGF